MAPHSNKRSNAIENPFILSPGNTHGPLAAIERSGHEVVSTIGPTFTVPTSPSVSSISSDDDEVEDVPAPETTRGHALNSLGATFQVPDWSLTSMLDSAVTAGTEGSSMSVDSPQQPVYQRVPVSQWNNADYDQYLRVEHGWSLEMLQRSLDAIQSGGLPPFVEAAKNIMKDLQARAVKEIETEKIAYLNRLRKQAMREIEAEKLVLREQLEQEHKELKKSIALLHEQKEALEEEVQLQLQDASKSLPAAGTRANSSSALLNGEPNPSLSARQLESYERQMTATNKYTPKQPSRLRKVSRLSSSSLGSPQFSKANTHNDSTMEDAPASYRRTINPSATPLAENVFSMSASIPLWQPIEDLPFDPEARAAAENLVDTTENPFLSGHFVEDLTYEHLSPEDAAEVRAAVEQLEDPHFDALLPSILIAPLEPQYNVHLISAQAQAEVRAFAASV
jgi:hypothetical protein